jgi:hypothetical protein
MFEDFKKAEQIVEQLHAMGCQTTNDYAIKYIAGILDLTYLQERKLRESIPISTVMRTKRKLYPDQKNEEEEKRHHIYYSEPEQVGLL